MIHCNLAYQKKIEQMIDHNIAYLKKTEQLFDRNSQEERAWVRDCNYSKECL